MSMLYSICQSWGWGLISSQWCPQFLNRPKKNSNSISLLWDFEADNTFTTRWSGGIVQVWVQVWAPAFIWQSLPEDNRRFRGQNLWPSCWGRALARLARVGQARTNTGRFRVGCSRCGQRPARLRKTYFRSCDTDSVRESKRF